MRELHAAVVAPVERVLLTVGETPGVTVEHAVQFTDPANAELDMVFQFEHQDLDHGPAGRFDPRPLRLTDLKASLGRWQTALADRGWNSLYWNNHDQPRVVSRFGSDQPANRVRSAKLLATVLHLHRGTPYVYQGEELGMTNYPFRSLAEFEDIGSVNWARQALSNGLSEDAVVAALRAASRDNARTPMQWDDTANAGFTTGAPWLPVNPNYVEINAAAQLEDPDSVFQHYRRLIELRHELPVVALGDFTMRLPDDDHIYAFTRRLDDTELLVLANVDDDPHSAGLDDAATWRRADILVSNYADAADLDDGPVPLRPWEARVYQRRAS
jgi:oligo-1,6-glucosidase